MSSTGDMNVMPCRLAKGSELILPGMSTFHTQRSIVYHGCRKPEARVRTEIGKGMLKKEVLWICG